MSTPIGISKILPIRLSNNNYCLKRILMCLREYSDNKDLEDNKLKRPLVTETDILPDTSPDILEEPTTCCMSGCANCVWIQYAEKLSAKLINSNDNVRTIIIEKVQDPNMRAFLLMELKCRNLAD